ncbi:MAG: GIY-YIG nuclease family protein [Aminipila sp.]
MSIEVIYRVYETNNNSPQNEIIEQNVLICNDRKHFKEIIKDTYDGNIKFASSRKYSDGQLYCIIIGEQCYNTERYTTIVEFECPHCHKKLKIILKYADRYRISDYDIKTKLGGDYQKYSGLRFCSEKCAMDYLNYIAIPEYRKKTNSDIIDEYITHESFDNERVNGYIYKISKRSTGEFYIGQTVYVPIFRWGQHLKTDRFPISNIDNYIFEILEIVKPGDNILEREKYWIQKYYKDNPGLSLNIMLTKSINTNQLSIEDINYIE